MSNLKQIGFRKIVDERRVDIDGAYRARVWKSDEHVIEVNQDKYGYHARVDHNSRTTKANMNPRGMFDWLMSLFDGE